MELITIILIIVAWIFAVLAPAAKLAYEAELNQSGQKRGVSFFPFFPLMPVLAIMIMYGINFFYNPIGTYVSLGLHLVLLMAALFSMIYWSTEFKKVSGYIGFWVFNIVNLLICLVIITGVPYLIWQLGLHWTWILASAIVCFFGSGFLAERVLFKLTWAERLFGEIKGPGGDGMTGKETAEKQHQAEKVRRQAEEAYFAQEAAKRTKSKHIDFRDFTTEIDIAEKLLPSNLNQTEFTVEDEIKSIVEEDLFKLIREGRPEQYPKTYYINESGIRIFPDRGLERLYTYDGIEHIELDYTDADGGSWDRPLPIYKANLLYFTVDGTLYKLPFLAPWAAAWFVIQRYNRIKEQAFRTDLNQGKEIPIGKDEAGETVCLSANGFRCANRFFSVEDLWWVIIGESGSVEIKDKKKESLLIILDYALPESYVFLHFIREMVLPRRIPEEGKKFFPGYINWIKTRKIGAGFAAAALICFVVSGYFAFYGMETMSWPETTGIVLSNEVSLKDNGEEGPIMYELNVSYRYMVDGSTYSNDKFKFGSKSFFFEKHALRLADQFIKGQEIPVYFNPHHPRQAVLEKGVGFDFYFWTFCGVILLLVVVYYTVFVYRKAEVIRKKYNE